MRKLIRFACFVCITTALTANAQTFTVTTRHSETEWETLPTFTAVIELGADVIEDDLADDIRDLRDAYKDQTDGNTFQFFVLNGVTIAEAKTQLAEQDAPPKGLYVFIDLPNHEFDIWQSQKWKDRELWTDADTAAAIDTFFASTISTAPHTARKRTQSLNAFVAEHGYEDIIRTFGYETELNQYEMALLNFSHHMFAAVPTKGIHYTNSIPPYAGGHVFQFDTYDLSPRELNAFEAELAAYKADSGSDVQLLFVGGSTQFTELLQTFDTQGYTPNGLRFVFDTHNNEYDIAIGDLWLKAGAWNAQASQYVQDNIMNGLPYSRGTATKMIEEIQRRVPKTMTESVEIVNQQQKTKAVLRGGMWRMLLYAFAGLTALLLAIAVARKRKKEKEFQHNTTRIMHFYNADLPVFEADIENMPTLKERDKKALQSELRDVRAQIENWLEESAQTYAEATQLAETVEQVENKIMQIVNIS